MRYVCTAVIRGGNSRTRLSNLLQLPRLVKGRVRIWTQATARSCLPASRSPALPQTVFKECLTSFFSILRSAYFEAFPTLAICRYLYNSDEIPLGHLALPTIDFPVSQSTIFMYFSKGLIYTFSNSSFSRHWGYWRESGFQGRLMGLYAVGGPSGLSEHAVPVSQGCEKQRSDGVWICPSFRQPTRGRLFEKCGQKERRCGLTPKTQVWQSTITFLKV